jgi:uncharacterized repeat protein (TIGR03987 family)
MTLALVFYSLGVWGEKLSGGLKLWNLSMFWIGLIMDSTGTAMMSSISGTMEFNLHSMTGALAILLMVFHALWATIVLLKKKEKLIRDFHKFSIVVWLIWLIPYFTGIVINIS